MRINFAHIRERSTSGGWIDFAVFDAKSTTGLDSDNAKLLVQLTLQAQALALKIDKAALVYEQNGQIRFYGTKDLVDYLTNSGIPQWTHYLDV